MLVDARDIAMVRARRLTAAHATAIVVGLLVVATVATRLPIAMRLTLWEDEAGAARIFTTHGPVGALKGVYRTESTPPGWYMLAWFAHRAGADVGTRIGVSALASAKTVRLLSVLFSAVTTAFTVVLARRVLPLAAAALAGVWMTFGYELVDHGTEGRAYAMLAMMAVLLAYALEGAVAEPSRRRLLALAAVTAVGAYTHYFFFFSVATGAAWLWIAPHERPVRLRVTAALAAGSATFLPWAPGFLHQLHSRPHGYLPRFNVATMTHIYSNIFSPAYGPFHDGEPARLVVLAVVLAGGVVLVRRGATLYAALATVPLLLGAAAWATGPRIWDARNLLEVAPFAAIAIAAAADAIPWRWASGVVMVALAAVTLTFFLPLAERHRTEWDRFNTVVAQMGWQPTTPVMLFGRYLDTVAMSWYMPGNPRLHFGKVAPGCGTVFVVALDDAGKRWLREHATAVQGAAGVPWYGRFEGTSKRGPDLRVAKLSWSPGIARDAQAKGAMLLHTGTPGGPVCHAS
jgi:Dolichyl-phosphate-mannose-protein mannosyltransferase